jgi:hypothetical protein
MPPEAISVSTASVPTLSELFGLIQESRGSDLQAGARAELCPSPLTLALGSMMGRIAAQTMIYLVNSQAAVNFTAARIPLSQAAMIRAIPAGREQPILADIATAYSPLSVQLAHALPHATIVEMDRPDVIRKRMQRLQRGNIDMPANLRTFSADLRHVPLEQAFEGLRPDVIEITGAYLNPAQLTRISEHVCDVLTPGGALICYLPWRAGLAEVQTAMRFFKRQVSDMPGAMSSERAIIDTFTEAGFVAVRIDYPSQLAETLGVKTPVLDVEVLVTCRKAG